MSTWRVTIRTKPDLFVDRQCQYAHEAFQLARPELARMADIPGLSFGDCVYAERIEVGPMPTLPLAKGRTAA